MLKTAWLSQPGNYMIAPTVEEFLKLKLELIRSQAQVLSLQNDKLEALFNETAAQLESIKAGKETTNE